MRRSAGRLAAAADGLRELLAPCRLCPNECGIDRLSGELGRCGVGSLPRVASYGPHFGEESVLVGESGSGTVFLSGCSLECVYCQNWTISQARAGSDLSVRDLAEIYLQLQDAGCENLNLVTPTHQTYAIVAALEMAFARGLRVPIVWNCGGYESTAALRLLDGIVDIYMPDLKYADSEVARRLSGVSGYVDRTREAVLEMHRQVGDLLVDRRGVARSGLLVRHLVLPNDLAGTEGAMQFLAEEVSVATYVNLMDQYRPCYRVDEVPDLARRTTRAEYLKAARIARAAGLHRFA